jgi:hypothetical protein
VIGTVAPVYVDQNGRQRGDGRVYVGPFNECIWTRVLNGISAILMHCLLSVISKMVALN